MDNKIKETDEQIHHPEEKEIDLFEMAYKLWDRRKTILIWCMWGVLAGLIIAFSIPREYSTSVKLAPEFMTNSRSNLAGRFGTIAALAGMNANNTGTSDAVYPQLYPDIVGSVPFIMSLMEVPVKDKDDNTYTVREYILEKTRGPWWRVVMGAPGKVIGWIRGGKKDEGIIKDSIIENKTFRLSPEDYRLVGALRNRIASSVDQKTSVITIDTKMQDPVVSAILADTVVSRLREYITDYRTDKARQDLDYALKLNDEAQQDYYNAQQRLADYTDRNQSLATQSARITRDRLQNEASLAFNLYNETALKVQHAKSKVQETTPVYTEIKPATVPLRPISPRKGLIIAGCTFLAFVSCCAWILFGNPMVKEYKTKLNDMKMAANKEDEEKAKKE